MSTLKPIEDRLHDHYVALADELQLQPLDFDDLLLSRVGDGHSPTRRRLPMLIAAAAVVVAVLAALAILPRSDGGHPTATTQTAAPTTIAFQLPATTADPTRVDALPEVMPYIIQLPDTTSGVSVGQTDPPAGGVGTTFVSADGSLEQMMTFVSFPLDSKQLPRSEPGAAVDVPVGSATWAASTEYPDFTTLRWQLPDAVLMVRGFRMDRATTLTRAIEFVQGKPLDRMRFDGTWGDDSPHSDLTVLPVVSPTNSTDTVPEAALVAQTQQIVALTFGWSPEVYEYAGGPQAVKTTVLGQPAWRVVVESMTEVTWQQPDSQRWLQLTAPTASFDRALAALKPNPDLNPNATAGRLIIPSLGIDADTGNRVRGTWSATQITHVIGTSVPPGDGHASLFAASNDPGGPFEHLDHLTPGDQLTWTMSAAGESYTYAVTQVATIDANTDPAQSKADLALVTYSASSPSPRRTVVYATRVGQPHSTTTSVGPATSVADVSSGTTPGSGPASTLPAVP